MPEMSKSEFASHIGVSPGRITQYISAGIIGPDALVGEGRLARIDVERAKAQISKRRHVGQALGNGIATRLVAGEQTETLRPDTVLPARDKDTAELIQLERLEQEKRKNRQATIDEARMLGQLVPVEDMQRAVASAAQKLVNTFTGMAPDIANAIAAKFGVPQRDVLHLVKQVISEKRAMAAQGERDTAEQMPETVEAVIS